MKGNPQHWSCTQKLGLLGLSWAGTTMRDGLATRTHTSAPPCFFPLLKQYMKQYLGEKGQFKPLVLLLPHFKTKCNHHRKSNRDVFSEAHLRSALLSHPDCEERCRCPGQYGHRVAFPASTHQMLAPISHTVTSQGLQTLPVPLRTWVTPPLENPEAE